MNFTEDDLQKKTKHKPGDKPSKKQGEKTKCKSLIYRYLKKSVKILLSIHLKIMFLQATL